MLIEKFEGEALVLKTSCTNFYVYIYLDKRKVGNFTYGKLNFEFEPLYVGKGSGKRIDFHLSKARKNSKLHSWLYNKIRKIEREGFTIEKKFIEKKLEENKAFEIEKETIKYIGRLGLKQGPLVNCTDGGEEGFSHSEETKRKISEHSKNRLPISEDTRRKICESARNRPQVSEETRAKISRSKKGQKHSEETKKRMSESQKRLPEEIKKKRLASIKFTDESRRKLSIAAKGRRHSEETKEKIRNQNGWKHSDKTKEKIKEARRKQVFSEEDKKKMRESAKYRPSVSEETRRKMSITQKGKKKKPMTEKAKNKISNYQKNRWKLLKAA